MTEGIKNFFKSPNKIQWHQIENKSIDEEWFEHVELCIKCFNERTGILILPNCISNNKTTWYVCTESARTTQLVEKELWAFLGHLLEKSEINVKSQNDQEELIKNMKHIFPGPTLALEITDEEHVTEVRNILSIYSRVLLTKPKINTNSKKPFSQIRRDFDLSLLSGDETEARKNIEKLKSTGRLGVENDIYLEIRLLTGLKRWDTFDTGLLRKIKNFVPPMSTINDICEYYFQIAINKYIETGDLVKCMKALEEKSFQEFGCFFKRRSKQMSISASYSYLLSTLFDKNPDPAYQHEIYKSIKDQFPSKLLDEINLSLKDLKTEQRPATSIEAINLLIEDLEFDQALEKCLELTPSALSIKKIYQCFRDELPDEIKLRERSYIESIVLHYNQLDKNESEKLHQKITSAFVDLKNIFEQDDISSTTKPDSWIGWLRSVEGGLSSSDSKNFLNTEAKLWDVKRLIHNGNDWEYFIQSLFGGENNSEKFRCYDEAFSNLYDCFIEELDEFPDVMNSFGLKLLFNLALKEELPTNIEKYFIFELQKCLLQNTLSKDQYIELIELCRNFFDKLSSYSHLDWILDVLEHFSANAKPDKSSFESLFSFVQAEAFRYKNRLSISQIEVFNELCFENNNKEATLYPSQNQLPTEMEANPFELLKDKKIGIYTLEENAGNRAKRILEKEVKCNVTVNSDKYGTDRLEELASNADLFVCAWKASKHAATIFIEKFRSTEDIIKPSGKGSSSIINALLEQAA